MSSRAPWSGSTRRLRLPPDWPSTRARILARDGYRCRIGGSRCLGHATQADHVVRGDDHRDENLQAACEPCHLAKTAAEANAERWKVRASRPAERHPGLIEVETYDGSVRWVER